MSIIKKRKGHREKFDESKVYNSICATCESIHYNEKKCERIAKEVTEKIKKFIKNKKTIRASELRKKIENELKKKNKELAFYYEHHLPNLKKL